MVSAGRCPSLSAVDFTARRDYFKNHPEAPFPPRGPGKRCQCQINRECLKMRYVQPEIPASYKPYRAYEPPTQEVDSSTVYKLSYQPNCGDARPQQVRQPDNLHSSGSFSNDTTQKLSYPGWPCAASAEPIKPTSRALFDAGPLQSQTTNRHDYTPKPLTHQKPFKPSEQIRPSDKAMEDTTTMGASYQTPDLCSFDPAVSYKPHSLYRKPSALFASDTVHKRSYMPVPIREKEIYPWALKPAYQPPTKAMEGDTIYNNSYLRPCGDQRRSPFLPEAGTNIITSDTFFNAGTIYSYSYIPNCASRPPLAVKQPDNLHVSCQEFAGDTTQRLSYPGWPCAASAEPIKPTSRALFDAGPLQSQTTNRHDYTPKPLTHQKPFKPSEQIRPSDKAMEDTTTMGASYQTPDLCSFDPAVSYKPHSLYRKPSALFASDTVHKRSYMPVPIREKEIYPWALKPAYRAPTKAMQGDTIYNNSFISPGHFMPAERDECPPAECCYCMKSMECENQPLANTRQNNEPSCPRQNGCSPGVH